MRTIITILLGAIILLPSVIMAQSTQYLDQRNLSYQTVGEKAPQKVQIIISKCYDLSFSGLGQDAKKTLIDAIYDSSNNGYESALRFALGEICYDLKEYEGAKYQWNIIYAKYPQSEETEAIKIIFSEMNWNFEDWVTDQQFSHEYELSTLFWNSLRPEPRMNPTELIDPIMAVGYLQELYNRYPDESKRAIILYDLFQLFMGYNDNGFGYFHATEGGNDGPSMIYFKAIKTSRGELADLSLNLSKDVNDQMANFQKNAKVMFLSMANSISDSLNKLSIGKPYYIRTQFLIGVSFCGVRLFSSKLKVNKEALPYFQHVIDATNGEETNLYRLFALKWLSEAK
jgi:hypothetical protein